MASGFRRKRGNDEYVFIDGVAMRAEEAVRIDLREQAVPGQAEAASVPGAQEAHASKGGKAGKLGEAFRSMSNDDALELTPEVLEGNLNIERTRDLLADERRKMRAKYAVTGVVLLLVALASLCMSSQHFGMFKSPVTVVSHLVRWVQLGFIYVFQNANYHAEYLATSKSDPLFFDTILQFKIVLRYVACGALLALSGMLYQNAFKNPIAAPSMLGVTNGINFALLILVLQFGWEALNHTNLYYVYSIVGGIIVLLLVMLGGKWISGKGQFNTVNMILMGTIISQLLGVFMQYVQANFMDETQWEALYLLQNSTGSMGIWMYGTLIIGGLVAIIPVVLFRFKLNLISFSDDETKLLGVDPTKLRLLALACGSVMILVAQVNAGQVAMISLIIPFLVRAVYGSEFRKQLGGNILMGALVLLLCGDVSTLIIFDGYPLSLASVVSIVAIPLFVWMMALNQKTWE